MSCGCGSGGCGTRCVACKVVTGILALITTATTVAAAIGVYMTHMRPEGWVFGDADGSLAIVAFLASIVIWHKLVKKLCPCGSKGACGCGASGNCGSGSGGSCPGCHRSPCVCK